MPPALPTYMSRDHLHDRNRETALYDPARPGLETYVRVTRRRGPPEVEAELARQKAEREAADLEQAREFHEDSNELLALRSMLMQDALNAGTENNQKVAAGIWRRPEKPREPSAAEARAAELQSKLGIDRVKLVTSPMFIDTTPQAGHNTAAAPAPAPAPASAAWQAAKAKTVRGGTWPVDQAYFAGGKSTKAKEAMVTEATGQLKTVVYPSG